MPPKVSVGMPVYNGQDYVRDAIEAILNQTYQDFELVISDNFSTDQTSTICKKIADEDPRVRYVCQRENLGAIENFNALIDLAKGEYFKWAAHDDLMEPAFLEKCVQALEQNESVVWCHSKSDMIDAQGRSFLDLLPDDDEEIQMDANGHKTWKGHPRKDFDSSDPIQRFRGVILGTNWCIDSYGLFRIAALRKTRRLLHFYGAEKVLLGEISLLGTYYEVPELLFYQRIHEKSSSNLTTASSQAEFAKPGRTTVPFISTRLDIIKAHLGSVLGSPLSWIQKSRGLLVVLRYLLQIGKLRRVISQVINRRGPGGGGSRIMDNASRHASTRQAASSEKTY